LVTAGTLRHNNPVGAGSRLDDLVTATRHTRTQEKHMKPNIHPNYVETQVTCTCGNSFTTRSTSPSGTLHADVCSACHPFYTGKQKILDTGGRVARFEKRYAAQRAAK
jgi:large subunit ribosomal protein L31